VEQLDLIIPIDAADNVRHNPINYRTKTRDADATARGTDRPVRSIVSTITC
jgi:hypothetical protein